MNICSTHLKLKQSLTYVTLKEFWMELEHLTRNFRIKNLDGFERDETDARAGLLNVKEKGITMCYIMNRCLVMFLRGEKVNVVLHWWNISVKLKGQQVIILQMDQLLQTKNISDVPYLCTW